jgi:polyhydroxybutyrate depolymerase
MTARASQCSLILVAALCLAACTASAETVSWTVGGINRSGIVYRPTKESPGGKAPLVFSFHGRGDDMENFQYTDMHRAWPHAVVIYFQGLPGRGGLNGWQTEKGQDADRDLALVDTALAWARKTFAIDDTRIYSTGFSNGAMFTYLLWSERAPVFAAFAPVAGRLAASARLTTPKPMFHIGGTADPQVVIDDQRRAIQAAIDVNKVGGLQERCGTECTLHGPESPTPVMTWIHRGGHIYPRGTPERIAMFFIDHPLKK